MFKVKFSTQCKCGAYLPRGATAEWNHATKQPYNCAACRPRDKKEAT